LVPVLSLQAAREAAAITIAKIFFMISVFSYRQCENSCRNTASATAACYKKGTEISMPEIAVTSVGA
jgi:hypothetical protein